MKIEGTWEELFSWASSLTRKRSKKTRIEPARIEDMPVMKMTQTPYQQIIRDIGIPKPERGGVVLGPVDEKIVTHFIFDATGVGTAASWTFGHQWINEVLKKYAPLGLDMKGFVHSHPSGITSLSSQDLKDFRKPFDNAKNGDLTEVLAPLVVDGQIYPYILYRDNPKPVLARIVLC